MKDAVYRRKPKYEDPANDLAMPAFHRANQAGVKTGQKVSKMTGNQINDKFSYPKGLSAPSTKKKIYKQTRKSV